MKKIILLSFAAVFAVKANATVLTVSNNTNSPGQYNNLDTAYAAASNGDTLYIHASPNSYGNLTILKKLTFIGEGALPDQQVKYPTTLGTLSLSFAPFPATTTASGSRFIGLNISLLYVGTIAASSPAGIGSLTLTRNVISTISPNGAQYTSGNTLTQNLIGFYGLKTYNSVFSNNIIQYLLTNNGNSTEGGGNNLVSNNIIQYTIRTTGDLVTNNIFYNYSSSGSINTSSCFSTTFTKNLFFSFTAVTSGSVIYGSNTGTGNLFQQDPLFITPVLPSDLQVYSYSVPISGPFGNLHLAASSPGHNYGTDNMDIGLYGGGFPWIDGSTVDSRFRYFPMPNQLPYVISMDVLNSTILPSGTLNVNFNATTKQ